ncbi:hypothetical protein [Mesorhizobium sp. LNJC394B00]|nr:hypothetical protein [Mesorhizobium sp. LNJC394B00]ESW89741.1 hypothetical protein X770_12520 [Mesorhizobium sp. LSJC269B00]ESX46081.1 hypothetical protein X762_23650 [Mesorhizobium sp. LSHC426A00]ESX54879.1 hypothetical protein X761_15445 [Mesorhizobium sp. LSHC424B00]ESX69145.1 hypothetical protein X758_20250 [Mesorhizobium sp. LSHC416B00]ESY47205.1 hypothetical protein X746_13460 [Mesorhizobium sp. LNJC380A00]ESZ08187.1 hypothetical protein X736_07275 [Mesorhizobium sp. L2C089B000]ESZ3
MVHAMSGKKIAVSFDHRVAASPSELRNAIHASLAMANGYDVSWSAEAR